MVIRSIKCCAHSQISNHKIFKEPINTMLKFPPPSLRSPSSSPFLSSSSSLSLRTINMIFHGRNTNHFSSISASTDHHGPPQDSSFPGGESFFRNTLSAMENVYLERNPTAKRILDLVHSYEKDHICYDHFAFRTFGVNDHGIDSIARFFMDFGYVQRDELSFPAKKLKAYWFSPPSEVRAGAGAGVNGPLPRIFISQLLVDQMTSEAQKIIKKYTAMSGNGYMHSALASALGCLTWETPSFSEFQQLARESEYAAWTLVNGYALNHVTVSAHRLKSNLRKIDNLNKFIEENGFRLNSEGGILKVSPDGLLLQSSTVADSSSFHFSEGITESIPRCYIEFAERLVLPQFKNVAEDKVEEFHRRDGFEVGNADKIFESTSKDQLSRQAA
ncbi:uncharacterized protein LOC125207682 isoform X1 [Salvia hispanica]|uniref:uncharacterized protein LOC125207682 isoform X1 n=1 Tax=Salvia hispanica TaxID=49212 RepID=UPI002009864F|nr:uncharacterized protein LOC125207682 isoform X1 [Salvia hispanica]